MAFVVVGAEKSLNDLLRRSFSGRLSASEKKRVSTALERSNPGVDLASLERGMILSIPDVLKKHVRPEVEEGVSFDDVTKSALQAAQTAVAGAIKELVDTADEQERLAGEERRALAQYIDSEEFQRTMSGDPTLAAEMAEVRTRIDVDDDVAERTMEEVKAAAAQWTRQLDVLKMVLQ